MKCWVQEQIIKKSSLFTCKTRGVVDDSPTIFVSPLTILVATTLPFDKQITNDLANWQSFDWTATSLFDSTVPVFTSYAVTSNFDDPWAKTTRYNSVSETNQCSALAGAAFGLFKVHSDIKSPLLVFHKRISDTVVPVIVSAFFSAFFELGESGNSSMNWIVPRSPFSKIRRHSIEPLRVLIAAKTFCSVPTTSCPLALSKKPPTALPT